MYSFPDSKFVCCL